MILVVDTSVILKWFVPEPDQDRALALLAPGLDLAAPDFALAEVLNVLWRKQRGGEVSEAQVNDAADDLHRFFKQLAPSAHLLPLALKLARELRHSVYDCMFLALAAALDNAKLVTIDDRFAAKVQLSTHRTYLKPLSDFAPISEI